MKRTKLGRACCAAVCLMLFAVLNGTASAQEKPPVPSEYQRLFAHYADRRSMLEKSLNLIGMTDQDVGRSFAVVAGVSHYPRLPAGSRTLAAAEADRDMLVAYLEKEEFFDEVVVLWDEDMNKKNLAYFLQQYFPQRLHSFPKSRFLFAYSGHGFSDGGKSYLLANSATGFADRGSAVDLGDLRSMIQADVRAGFQTLVLLNSCYAGAFLTRSSFGSPYIPRHPGAHAITAGASQERAWSDTRFGLGSVFFEKVLEGLGGAADRIPEGGDGIITASELYAYLRQEVEVSTDQLQNPQFGDLSDSQSEGEFFFLSRRRQVRAGLVPEWNPMTGVALGGNSQQQDQSPPGESRLRAVSGTIPLEGIISGLSISGSFGVDKIEPVGGTLRIDLSLSQSSARYEQIEFRTASVSRTFTGKFAPGFGDPPVPVELSTTLQIVVTTSRPSRDLAILPGPDGGFVVAPFYTADCGFSCYSLEISGSWSAKGPKSRIEGAIHSILDGRGFGADATCSLDPTGFPKTVRLTHFSWHGNSGGAAIPDLVDATVDGVPLRISVSYAEFPGVRDANVLLTETY